MDDPDISKYVPMAGERNLTARALAAGCVLGAVVCAININFGLRTGWAIGGSLFSAILAFAFFGRTSKKTPYSVLEANITQTTASASGTMISAAGLLTAIPALQLLGHKLSYLQLTAWAASVGFLGVFIAAPLRRQLIVQEKLRFPEGTAAAEAIMSMFSSGDDAKMRARVIFWAGVGAGVFALAAHFVPQLQAPPMAWFGLAALSAWGFSLIVSPTMVAAGILVGPRTGWSLLLGAVVGWGLLGPFAQAQGWAPGKIMSWSDGVRGWLLWPGVAMMAVDSLTTLVIAVSSAGIFSRRSDDAEASDSISRKWWGFGYGAAALAACATAYVLFEIPVWMTVLALVLSTFLSVIATRTAGETNINPVGGMGKVTQLAFSGVAPGMIVTNLASAGLTAAGAAQCADMMQDFKTGHLLNASPRDQMRGQLVGVTVGILVCVPLYLLFDAAYGIGSDVLQVPSAQSWKAFAELVNGGWEGLPPKGAIAVAVASAFGAGSAILRRNPTFGRFVPSGLAVGMSFIMLAFYSVAIFLGTALFLVWGIVSRESATTIAFPTASGFLAGEALMGIVVAVLTMLGVS